MEEHIRELEEALSEETDLAILADLEAELEEAFGELEALKERCAPPGDGFGDDGFPDDDFDDGTDF